MFLRMKVKDDEGGDGRRRWEGEERK